MIQPIITLFCPFTRRWAIDRWIADLRSSKGLDPTLTNLVFIVDTDEPYIASELLKMGKADGYRSCRVEINTENNPNEVRIAIRRKRIVDVKNQSKGLIAKTDGELILGLEDDTVFADTDFSRLWKPLADLKVGFVEGVCCGRWGVKIVGAWQANDPANLTNIATILPHGEHGYERISAGGFYGYVTRREEYLQHVYNWDESQPWGPDVNYGLWLRGLGYTNLIDWGTKFGHNDYNRIIQPEGSITRVAYTKNDAGIWIRTDTEQDRWE